jgi:hypothetical protein
VPNAAGRCPAEIIDPIEEIEARGAKRKWQVLPTGLGGSKRYHTKDREKEEQRREKAPRAALVEVEERDSARPRSLLQEESGDQESAEDEEDVDAEGAADENVVSNLEVIEHDGEHGDTTKTIQSGSPAEGFCCHTRLIASDGVQTFPLRKRSV